MTRVNRNSCQLTVQWFLHLLWLWEYGWEIRIVRYQKKVKVFFSPWKIKKCPWKVLEFWFDKAVRTLIHIEGSRCRLLPGSVPRVWKKLNMDQATSNRSRRRVRLVSFTIACMYLTLLQPDKNHWSHEKNPVKVMFICPFSSLMGVPCYT